MKLKIIAAILAIATLSVSCFEDNDDNIGTASALEIQNFIYRGLNFFYVYKADTPELANDAFASEGDLNEFLNGFATPEALFDYLTPTRDRFSILVEDYVQLENALAGITKNNGMEFGLVRYPTDPSLVFGYVRYVLPNSDAAAKGLQRGDIFTTVDGTQITDLNFSELLDRDSYTIGLATFDGTDVTPTEEEVALTKAIITENPIHISKTLSIDGQNIGYLMYNGFTNEFDSELNAVFAQFRADNVSDLIIDLRYNGGGSVRTSTYLAGMITGQFTDQVFYQEQWNADRQADYASDGLFLDQFVNGGETINSLNLSRVYILTTDRTASASELLINGLEPYINVIQVGTNTTGKFQASFLLYDAPAPNFRRSEANPSHTYAMLPLVFQTANALGVTDFNEGLVPDIELDEDFSNLGVLGDPSEPLLAAALSDILPVRSPIQGPALRLETISDSKTHLQTNQLMILEPRQ